jgi:RHS repeat-associated protein
MMEGGTESFSRSALFSISWRPLHPLRNLDAEQPHAVSHHLGHLRGEAKAYDAAGMMTEASDGGGTIRYTYRPDGQPILVEAPDGVRTVFRYDAFGRRVAINDPSAGARDTRYDSAGNVATETDADGRSTRREYDRYGRVTRRVTAGLETAYTYDDGENLLVAAVSTDGTATRYAYDALGRVASLKEEAPDGKWLLREYTYRPAGSALASTRYTSQDGTLATELYGYRNGYLTETRLDDGTLVYRHDGENERGQLSRLAAGEMTRHYEFDGLGLPTRRAVDKADGGIIFDQRYAFEACTGNLKTRVDATRGITETFGYDRMNRLTDYGDHAAEYAPNGNVIALSDGGEQDYASAAKPYATTGFNPENGGMETGVEVPEITVDYAAGDRPSAIRLAGDSVTFAYNDLGYRTRMVSPSLTRYYMGDRYELDVDSLGRGIERLYLGGGYYKAPAALVKADGQATVYYIHRDYLGSVLQVADARGNVVEENNFAPYGCRRDPATLAYYPAGQAPPLMLGRGFTGHEHLPRFGLVNMNARLYDPVLGRFLTPDPYVQLPDRVMSLNRYAYAMDNPLSYVDENGEFPWIAIGALVGGIINVATHWNSIDNFWDGLGYFGVGAAAGAVAVATGGLATGLGGLTGGIATGMASGMTSGFVLNSGNTLMGGGSFGEAMTNGAHGAVTGGLMGAAMGGIMEGATALLRGQNFWNGQQIAAGRNAFSLNNTPAEGMAHGRATASLPDEMPIPASEDPLLNSTNGNTLTPYQKGRQGVEEAIREFKAEGGTVYQKEVSIELNGVRTRFDFAGELKDELHLFEVKNGPNALLTPNQRINIPQMMKTHPPIVPVGRNAGNVPQFMKSIGKPYTKGYIVVFKHYF